MIKIMIKMIPKKAKKTFKGIIFEVYQWKQKMFDNTYETFEIAKRKNTVQIILVEKKNKKIILADEKQPLKKRKNSFIGGRIEEKETPLQTAKRELLEETGMKGKLKKLKTFKTRGKLEWKIHYYIAYDLKKIQKPQFDSGEKIKLKKVTLKQFLKIILEENYPSTDIANYLKTIILKEIYEKNKNKKEALKKIEKLLFEL